MKILMCTNTFPPHVGGVARSVAELAAACRARGHRVLVAAPTFADMPETEEDVVRFPAIQHFNGSDFSVPLPVPGVLAARLDELEPDLVHSHHPFLLGDTALRIAASRALPIVFTHHTMYERYTHYVPGDSPGMQRFAIELATGYANLCDAVVAPSESIARILAERQVSSRIVVIPTGVDLERFRAGDRAAGRMRAGIAPESFVVGHVGRLAPEKNLDFLAAVLARFAAEEPRAVVLVIGDGPSRDSVAAAFAERGVAARLRLAGTWSGAALADGYRAMDVFAFASGTETQGLVLAESMAAGVPVVAVDAPGAREVVRDGVDGRLLESEDADAFVAALREVRGWLGTRFEGLREATAATAARFSIDLMADRSLALYEELLREDAAKRPRAGDGWAAARRRLAEEWQIVRNVASAADAWRKRPPDAG